MKINTVHYNWKGALSKRKETKYILIHHRAGDGDAKSIHKQHLKQGFTGIGYNFYVRKDGSVYEGRPIDTVGAHATNYNSVSVGVCFEGDFHNTDKTMSFEQYNAGTELIKYLAGRYPKALVKRHGAVGATACPGKYFPFEAMLSSALKIATDITIIAERLASYGIVTDKIGLITEVSGDPDGRLYWLARKALEYINTSLPYNTQRKVKEYISANDITWELAHRGIVNDNEGLLKELAAHPNGRLYWLARKVVTFIRNRE